MNQKERWIISALLLGIAVLAATDILTDAREGARWWHLAAEGAVALVAVLGIFLLLRGTFTLRHSLAEEREAASRWKADAERWRSQSRKFVQGLSTAIDAQLNAWKLTDSEKEVAFLLLKGLSLKEIAEARKTSERTARTQSIAVYSKSGLAGRSELAAYFLEDLLPPPEAKTQES